MKLGICLFKYFPYGGLQRDMMQLVQAAIARSHEVIIYTITWEGPIPSGPRIRQLPVSAIRRHRRYHQFSESVQHAMQQDNIDIRVGFNKMPGLDVYFCADPCFMLKMKQTTSKIYRHLPRQRFFSRAEAAVFGCNQQTTILSISEARQAEFQQFYQTPTTRFVQLPPGISRSFYFNVKDHQVGTHMRRNLSLPEHAKVLLCVGSGFVTKGLDRSIQVLSLLHKTEQNKSHLLVAGQDNAASFKRLAKRLGVHDFVHFLGGQSEIKALMLAADALIHPARAEAGGKVLLEAALTGLPVVASVVCGYVSYLKNNPGYYPIHEPFDIKQFHASIELMFREKVTRDVISQHVDRQQQIYQQANQAMDVIENCLRVAHACN